MNYMRVPLRTGEGRHKEEWRAVPLEILEVRFGGGLRGVPINGRHPSHPTKVIAIIDNNGYVLAPLPVAPVNEADMILLPGGIKALKRVELQCCLSRPELCHLHLLLIVGRR